MTRNGLLIGEVAAKSGVSRKALRLYETEGILLLLAPPRLSDLRAGDALPFPAFVAGPGDSTFVSTRSGRL